MCTCVCCGRVLNITGVVLKSQTNQNKLQESNIRKQNEDVWAVAEYDKNILTRALFLKSKLNVVSG